VLVRGGDACRVVSGGLSSGGALVDVSLDVVPLPPRSSCLTVVGCLLGGIQLHSSAYVSLGRVCTLRKVRTIQGCLGGLSLMI
jgi:hypothetical protein